MGTNPAQRALYQSFGAAGYRMTKARKKILDVFNKSHGHMSVDEIYLSVRDNGDNVGLATIYRAVDSLAKAGILRKMPLAGDRVYYEVIDEKISGHHHHLICRQCQKIADYSDFVAEEIKLMKRLERIVAKAHKFRVDDHQLSFTGLCRSCQEKGGRSRISQ